MIKRLMIYGEWYDYPDGIINKLIDIVIKHGIRIDDLEAKK